MYQNINLVKILPNLLILFNREIHCGTTKFIHLYKLIKLFLHNTDWENNSMTAFIWINLWAYHLLKYMNADPLAMQTLFHASLFWNILAQTCCILSIAARGYTSTVCSLLGQLLSEQQCKENLMEQVKVKVPCVIYAKNNDYLQQGFLHLLLVRYTLKKKCSLFASVVALRTFNINGNFPMHRFFIMEKSFSDY